MITFVLSLPKGQKTHGQSAIPILYPSFPSSVGHSGSSIRHSRESGNPAPLSHPKSPLPHVGEGWGEGVLQTHAAPLAPSQSKRRMAVKRLHSRRISPANQPVKSIRAARRSSVRRSLYPEPPDGGRRWPKEHCPLSAQTSRWPKARTRPPLSRRPGCPIRL